MIEDWDESFGGDSWSPFLMPKNLELSIRNRTNQTSRPLVVAEPMDSL